MCNSVHMLIKFLEMKSIFTLVNIHFFEKILFSFFFFLFLKKCMGALTRIQANLLSYSKRIIFPGRSETSKDSPSPYDVSLIIPELRAATLIG